MTRPHQTLRKSQLARTAAALAVAFGAATLTSAPAVAAPKEQPKEQKQSFKFTKPFQTAAAPFEKTLAAAQTRADVAAASQEVTAAEQAYNNARGKAAKDQANVAVEAALAKLGGTLTAEKAQLETIFAAVGNEDDRFMAGNLALKLGGIARDFALQRRGLQTMLQSGKSSPADAPRYNFYAGRFSFALKDYPNAVTYLRAATAAGFHENDADVLLAESLNLNNQPAEALGALRQAVDGARAAGRAVPESWYARGYQIAYKAKANDQVLYWSAEAARAYPSPFNWLGALQLARETAGNYTSQEDLDVGRIAKRSGALTYDPKAVGREYISFIQAGVARRTWPEVLSWIDEGVRVGAISASDAFVVDARNLSNSGKVTDAKDLAGMVRDAATAPNGLTASGAGDMLLSGGDPAKAEAMYKIALTKPGIDKDRVMTRLAIAQFDQGNYPGAKASFEQVGGIRAQIGKLGAIMAAQKMAPPVMAAPAATPPKR